MTSVDMIRELSTDEAQMVTGGSNLNTLNVLSHYVLVNRWVSPLDTHALSPQPLPPGAAGQVFV